MKWFSPNIDEDENGYSIEYGGADKTALSELDDEIRKIREPDNGPHVSQFDLNRTFDGVDAGSVDARKQAFFGPAHEREKSYLQKLQTALRAHEWEGRAKEEEF